MEPIAYKEVVIDGKTYRVKVMPPSPEEHDETVWSRPKAGSHIQLQRRISLNSGEPTIITTIADQPR